VIQASASFKDNLAKLPPIDGVQRIDLVDAKGVVVDSIENKPGKQGSLAVYQYLKKEFGTGRGRIRTLIGCWRLWRVGRRCGLRLSAPSDRWRGPSA
jgi:hypothetical protein